MPEFHGVITVRNTEFPATYNADMENFAATVDGKRVHSKSWSGLATAVGVELRKREVAVSVDFIHPDSGHRGNTTRLHASQRVPMITWASGKKETADVTAPLRPDTDVAELRRLIAAARKADDALNAFRTAHRHDGYKLSTIVAAEVARVLAERDAAERVEGAIELDAV